MMAAAPWIAAAVLAVPSYRVGRALGRRWRANRGKYLAASFACIGVAASLVLFLESPLVIPCFGIAFGLQLGMRHSYGHLAMMIDGE